MIINTNLQKKILEDVYIPFWYIKKNLYIIINNKPLYIYEFDKITISFLNYYKTINSIRTSLIDQKVCFDLLQVDCKCILNLSGTLS